LPPDIELEDREIISLGNTSIRMYRLPEDKCQRMKISIDRVWDEPVDIVLGNQRTMSVYA